MRRLRMRQLSHGMNFTNTGYSPLGVYTTGGPAGAGATNPPMSPVPMWTPAPWSPEPTTPYPSYQEPWTPQPRSYYQSLPPAASPATTYAPIPMMEPPAPEVNMTAAMYMGGNDGQITISTIIDHNMFNGSTNSFMDVASMYDLWSHGIGLIIM